MQGGKLNARLIFQKRAAASDGYGNKEGDWVNQFERKANVRPQRGGETVMAQRLTGIQPLAITVRADSMTNLITAAWRAVDGMTGAVYDISSPVADPTGKRRDFEMTAQRRQ